MSMSEGMLLKLRRLPHVQPDHFVDIVNRRNVAQISQ